VATKASPPSPIADRQPLGFSCSIERASLRVDTIERWPAMGAAWRSLSGRSSGRSGAVKRPTRSLCPAAVTLAQQASRANRIGARPEAASVHGGPRWIASAKRRATKP
jgi:hypothetical protein